MYTCFRHEPSALWWIWGGGGLNWTDVAEFEVYFFEINKLKQFKFYIKLQFKNNNKKLCLLSLWFVLLNWLTHTCIYCQLKSIVKVMFIINMLWLMIDSSVIEKFSIWPGCNSRTFYFDLGKECSLAVFPGFVTSYNYWLEFKLMWTFNKGVVYVYFTI